METTEKKILVIGNSVKDVALIEKLLSDNSQLKIYATSQSRFMNNDSVNFVDIREDNPSELLEFAVKNEIALTIATSYKALNSDIVSYFTDNGQAIFAPELNACDFALDKSLAKKFLYKMNIPTPRFAIYEKEQLALDYLKNTNYPVIISCAQNSEKGIDRFACPTEHIAKTFVGDLFYRNEPKIVIEEYVYGHEFTFYTITDGYEVLPITSVANYKFLKEGEGGLLTDGIGCYCHDYKVPDEIENELMSIISDVILYCQRKKSPYVGILGVDCVLTREGRLSVLGFSPFFKDHDCDGVLKLINNNILDIFEACVNGIFADEYDCLNISEKSCVSATLLSRYDNEPILGLEDIEHSSISYSNLKLKDDKFYTSKNQKLVLTSCANTLTRARNNLYDDIEQVRYKSKIFRSDICAE
ncbi:hypothetical protein J6E39_08485 [bacterium]|nr:hypothetical protein [bacterium]